MSYTIQEVPGEEKPFKILDAEGNQVAESDKRDKAERFIMYRTVGDKNK